MRRKLLAWGVALAAALFVGSFLYSYDRILRPPAPGFASDVARLTPTKVQRIEVIRSEDDLQRVLAEARAQKRKISISGSRHSQGGQTYFDDAIVLDMRGYNKVLHLDVGQQLIRVQSGARWKDVQE